MKVRLAKKIMKRSYGSPRYTSMIYCMDWTVSKELPKIKQYWEPRWALYYVSKGGGYGRVDHRIVKAEKITERYSRKLMNCLARLAGETPFEIRDILGSSNKLKKYDYETRNAKINLQDSNSSRNSDKTESYRQKCV